MSLNARNDIFKLLSGSLLAKVFGVASTVIFARLLTKDQMAIFPVYLMLAGVPNLILTFGILSTFTRELPSLLREDFERARSLIATGSFIIFIGTIIPSLASYYWSEEIAVFAFRDASQAWIIKIMVPGFMAFMLSKIIEYVMWGRGQFGATSKVQIIESVVRPSATLILYFLLGYKGIVIGLVGAQFVMVAVGAYYIRDVLIGPVPVLYPVGKLIKESMPYYIGNYISFLRGDGDTLLVSTFLGPAALAEYYIAKILYSNVLLVQAAIDKVVLERLARFIRTPQFLDKVRQAHDQISQIAVPFVLLAIAVAPNALILLAGPRYADATWPTIVLLVAALVQFVAIPIDRAVFLSLPGYLRIAYSVIEAAGVVAAAVTLVPLIGITGMALARIIAPIGVCVFGLLLLWRRLGLELPFKALGTSLATALPGTVFVLLVTPKVHGIFAVASAVAIGASMWAVIFILLTYVFNRQLLAGISKEARQQWTTLVVR